jgi:hypothetical protein
MTQEDLKSHIEDVVWEKRIVFSFLEARQTEIIEGVSKQFSFSPFQRECFKLYLLLEESESMRSFGEFLEDKNLKSVFEKTHPELFN